MNQDIIGGRWRQTIGQVRSRWGRVTGSVWTTVHGRVEQFFGQLQERLGVARDRVLAATATRASTRSRDADQLADQMLDSDYGSSPRIGMDNLAATAVADPPSSRIRLIGLALGRIARKAGDQFRQHPGASLLAASASLGVLAAIRATPLRRGR